MNHFVIQKESFMINKTTEKGWFLFVFQNGIDEHLYSLTIDHLKPCRFMKILIFDTTKLKKSKKKSGFHTVDIFQFLQYMDITMNDLNQMINKKFEMDTLTNILFGSINLKITEILDAADKSSASESVIGLGKYRNANGVSDVILKIACSDDETDNSLSFERKLYDVIVPKILEKTPNIIKCIDILECSNLWVKLKNLEKSEGLEKSEKKIINSLLKMLGNINNEKCKDMPIHVLILEKSNGKKLSNFLLEDYKEMKNKVDIMEQIVLQIAYTLHIFEKEKLMHNDLHFQNIFIEILNKPITFTVYTHGYHVYSRQINFLIKIYDFDRSSLNNTENFENTLLTNSECADYGDCNEYQQNKDWFTFAHYLYIHMMKIKENTYLSDRIFHIFKDIFKNGNLAHYGRPCEEKLDANKKCEILDISNRIKPIDFLKYNLLQERCITLI